MRNIDPKVIFLIVFLNANRGSFNLNQSEGKKPIIAKVGQSVLDDEALTYKERPQPDTTILPLNKHGT